MPSQTAISRSVGDAAFGRIERAWVSTTFLNDWIYGTKTPPMPGHPDWTVDRPVGAAAARSLAAPELPFRAR